MRLSRFSIRRPVFTFVTMMLVLILGVVSFMNIPLKLIPEINPPIGVVVTNYSGASPTEVVEKVSKPIEESLSTIEGLDTISSTSQEGASLVLLQFSWATKIDEVQDEILSNIKSVPLPDEVNEPRFLKFDPSQFPIIQLSLTSTSDEKELQALAEDLKDELTKTEGVASVNLSGVTAEEVKVELNQDQLKKYQLSQSEIVDVIRANDTSLPGSPIETDGKELTTRVISTIDSVDTLKNLNVGVNPKTGAKIKLSDVADVGIKEKHADTITRANQKPSVLLSVLQQSDANTAQVSKAFQEKLNELLDENEKYEAVKADILFDQGEYVQKAIGNMLNTLILGGTFAMIVLFLFLRNVKSPLIIGIAIPYSVIVTFVLMYFSDFTLNIMTLGGLALGIGMLVDNAIVVIENIYRHLSMGKEPKKAAYEGAKEMGPAIIASTFTTIAVFLPVVFITGIIGDLFTEFSLTIAFSLFASLFVALTVVPMLASRWLKKPRKNIEKERQESVFQQALERAVKWSLRNRAIVIILTIFVFAASIFGFTQVGAVFLPKTDEGYFTIDITLENGTALSETTKVIENVEQVLEDEEDVEVYVSLIGSTQEESFRGTSNANIAQMYVKMVDFTEREQSTFDFVDDVKKDIEQAAEQANKTAEVSLNLQSSTGSEPNTLTFNVKDQDSMRLEENVDRIQNALSELDDVNEVTNDLAETVEELQVKVDREKALSNGLQPIQIAMIVKEATRGTDALQMTNEENGQIYMINVAYHEEVIKDVKALESLLIKKADGSFITLKDVATIERGEGPTEIRRIDKQSAVQFTVKYANDTNLGAISREVDEKIADLELLDETEITFGGDRELLESSMDDMILAFVLAIVFIYLVMAAQFESLKYPFVIMFTVPLMIIGVGLTLFATNTPISITVVIGLIVLAGIVVNNAIVIVDYMNQLKASGMKTYDAIIHAVKVRIRPVLMTAFTTILGLLPLAIGMGEGSEVNQPMGLTVIGGLISSTFLTLFIIPVVYSFFDKETRKLNKKYVTPDGQLIPAYLLEEKVERDVHEEEGKAQVPAEPQNTYRKEEIAGMLEHLLKMVKEDDSKDKDK
ncbi:efflux RND transporter permease subunit [Bacillus sp. FJAT-47783]|uniref:efflux RND transporter permease subunit n=1 Tax=Bacillus sp. FJAT-47783 TaxID=2922712 RepID=UPI001FAE27A9|nr:efflux RND transporter permease subunit [Bacillus sp. FJAT-47783]